MQTILSRSMTGHDGLPVVGIGGTVVNFGFHWTLNADPRLGRLGRLAYLIQNSGSERGL
jgi:hypothetical protein